MTLRAAASAVPPLRAASAAETAYGALKAMILDNRLPPGAQKLEGELAEAIGVSRTPVREALVRLAQDGLVEIIPRHGMRVRPISPRDMREIYAVLASLEPTAAELLAARGAAPELLAPLDEACTRMERAIAAEDRTGWAEADEAFHLGLVRLCGNRRLAEMVMQVWEQSHRARMFTLHLRALPERSTQEHRLVLEAIRAGDAARAGDVWREHRRRSGAELTALIERTGLAWL